MTQEQQALAAKAVDFLQAANTVIKQAAQSATGHLAEVDTSMPSLGLLTPVLSDAGLAKLREDLRNNAVAPECLADLIRVARSAAVALLGG